MKNILKNWGNLVQNRRLWWKSWRRVVTFMAMVVVFATTYAMILPAITLEKETGKPEQGVYLDNVKRESTASVIEEDKELPDGNAQLDSADQKTKYAHGIYTGRGDGYTLSVELKEEMKLPADVTVSVEEIREDNNENKDASAAWSSYMSAARIAAAREDRGEFTSVRFLKFAFFSNGKEVRPSQDIDVLVVPMEKDKVRNGDMAHVLTFQGSAAHMIEDLNTQMSGYRVTAYRFFYSSAVDNRNWGLLGLAVTEPKAAEQEEKEDVPNEAADSTETISSMEKEQASTEEKAIASTEETEASTEETAATEESTEAETPSTENADENRKSAEKLEYQGQDYQVVMTCDDKAGIPEGAVLQVTEIDQNSEDYEKYLREASETLEMNKMANPAARFFDIKIMDGEKEIEPAAPVSVEIIYDKPMEVKEGEKVDALHFGEKKTEVIENIRLEGENGQNQVIKDNTNSDQSMDVKSVTFDADSFSVYGVLTYTVDFTYEVNGKVYGFSMQGADTVSLRSLIDTLHIYEKIAAKLNQEEANAHHKKIEAEVNYEDLNEKNTDNKALDQFMTDIESVTFSDESLLVPAKVEEDSSAGKIKRELKLFPSYPLGLSESEVLALNAKKYYSGDWILISMKPFDTEETLTVKLSTGDCFEIKVTDAQDAIMVGDKVQTISNPAGTTIDLFDYWVVSQGLVGRDGWGDLDQTQGSEQAVDGSLNGTGNNKGINARTEDPTHGHALKFSPAWAGTVFNGSKIGNTGNAWESVNLDGKNGLNSYTGNGDPFQGIVQNTLSEGYPVLTDNQTIGSNGESLQYLFDPAVEHAGKASYDGVNQLLYVDPEGYYTYDSRDYAASLNPDKTFDLTKQTSTDSEIRGFWPFGTQNFWSGIHMKTQFSMPSNGQVLNPKQEYKDMQFEFSGDDDVWLYVDGVLIGDGGGIHNRTEIDINFAAGKVTVTGKKDPANPGDDVYELWLDDLYKAAGKYDDDAWEDIPGVEGHKRFKKNTYHTFDMFYLERGGGESNFYIHYNLISTVEFSAHKSFLGTERLQRDQFQFELTGLDGQYKKWTPTSEGENPPEGAICDKNGQYWILSNADIHAIMPKGGSLNGEGTVASPKKEHSTDGYTSYITGVTEDGNVNFGQAEISQVDRDACHDGNPSSYLYRVREIVPDDAVNENGIRWDQADEDQKSQGGFVKDNVVYDGRVYYWMGTVKAVEVLAGDGSTYTDYILDKSRFLNSDYTQPDTETTFFNFSNTYVPDLGSAEFTKVDGSGEGVQGAEFALFADETCQTPAINIDGDKQPWTAISDEHGLVKFDGVRTGTYYMKETKAPEGYKPINSIYKVVIEDSKDSTKTSSITLLGDETQTPVHEIYNLKLSTEGLEVDKHWKGGMPDDDASITYQLYQTSTKDKIGQYSIDVSNLGYGKPDWSNTRFFTNDELTGDKTHIKKGSVIEIVIATTSGGWSFDTLNELTPITSNQTIISDTLSGGKDRERRIRIEVTDESTTAVNLYGQLESCYDGNGGKPTISASIISEPSTSEDGETKLVGTVTIGKNTVSSNIEAGFSNLDPAILINKGSGDWTSVVKNLPEKTSDGEWETSYRYFVEEVESSIPSGFSFNNIYPDSAVPGETISIVNIANTPAAISIDIKKTDDVPNSTNYLAGAVFELHYRVDSTKSWAKATTIDGLVIEELDTDSRFVVPIEGITLTGLNDGQYRIEEISPPPEGYVITEEYPVVFTIENGEITNTDGTISKVRYSAANEGQNALFIIPNTPGAALPSAGGPGTWIYFLLGGALSISAVFLLRKRRLKPLRKH